MRKFLASGVPGGLLALCVVMSACGSPARRGGVGGAGAAAAGGGGPAGAGGQAGVPGAAGASGGAGGSAGSSTSTGGDGGARDAAPSDARDGGAPDIASSDTADGAAFFGRIACNPGAGGGDGRQNLVASGDPPEWKLAAGVQAGTLTATASFASTTYNQHFPYWIYTSATYVPGAPAILLLFGDGNQFLTDFHAAIVLDNLTAAKQMPPTVALFVDPPSDGDRVQTYDPPTAKYTTFLFDELLPAVIFGKYSVSRDPDAWSIVGYSASGGQGWEVLWNRPNDVHKFLGDNTSFGAAPTYGVDWVQVIKNAPARILRVSLLTSTNDLADSRGMWLVINENVAADLDAKGNAWRLAIGQGQHFPPVDGERDFPNALRWIWRGCSF